MRAQLNLHKERHTLSKGALLRALIFLEEPRGRARAFCCIAARRVSSPLSRAPAPLCAFKAPSCCGAHSQPQSAVNEEMKNSKQRLLCCPHPFDPRLFPLPLLLPPPWAWARSPRRCGMCQSARATEAPARPTAAPVLAVAYSPFLTPPLLSRPRNATCRGPPARRTFPRTASSSTCMRPSTRPASRCPSWSSSTAAATSRARPA